MLHQGECISVDRRKGHSSRGRDRSHRWNRNSDCCSHSIPIDALIMLKSKWTWRKKCVVYNEGSSTYRYIHLPKGESQSLSTPCARVELRLCGNDLSVVELTDYRPEVAMISVVCGWTCRCGMNESSLFSYSSCYTMLLCAVMICHWMDAYSVEVLYITQIEQSSTHIRAEILKCEGKIPCEVRKDLKGRSDGHRELNSLHLSLFGTQNLLTCK